MCHPAGYGPADPAVVAQMAGRGPARFSTETLAGGRRHPMMELPHYRLDQRNFGPVTIPTDQYFLMGDNRDNSFDSRFYGFVARDQILGRASAVALSLDPERTYRPRWQRFLTPLQ